MLEEETIRTAPRGERVMDATTAHAEVPTPYAKAVGRADSENVRVFAELNAMSSEQIPMLHAKNVSTFPFPRLHCPNRHSPVRRLRLELPFREAILLTVSSTCMARFFNRLVDQSEEMRISSIEMWFHDGRKSLISAGRKVLRSRIVFPCCKHHPW